VNILVDMTVLELPPTGVANVLTGLYGAVARLYPGIRVSGVHRRALGGHLPRGIGARRLCRALPPGAWRALALPYASSRSRGAVLHFPWNGGVPRLPAGTRVVTTLHDVLPLSIPGYFRSDRNEKMYRMERQRDTERSTVIVTDSEYSKSEILRHLRPPQEPVVIPCATTIGTYAVDVAPGPAPYFLYVGGIDARKSLDTLLDVFCRLRREESLRATLVVAGSSRHAPPALSAQLREAVAAGHAQATGYVDDRELARLYAGALALVYPSRYEGFGMPPLEAMTLGCPVIAARASSIPEVCADAALYIEPWSPLGIAEAIRRIADDARLRARLKREGTARAAQFSWEKAADTFVRLLEKL